MPPGFDWPDLGRPDLGWLGFGWPDLGRANFGWANFGGLGFGWPDFGGPDFGWAIRLVRSISALAGQRRDGRTRGMAGSCWGGLCRGATDGGSLSRLVAK